MYAPGVPPDIAVYTGPLALGFLFNVGLFGALSVQVYIYHLSFVKDQWKIRTVVYCIYIWELLQTILIIRDAYVILGSGWGDLAKPLAPELMWFSVPIQTGFVSLAVQSFFAWRILVLSRSKILVAAIFSIALTSGACALATGITIHISLSDDSQVHETTFVTTTMWLAASAVCDVMICICMCWFLGTARKRTTYQNTSSTLTRLINLSIGTGVLTACISAVDCALFISFQDNNFHIAPSLVLGKLYSNSLMVLLNNRLRTQPANINSIRWDEQSPEQYSGGGVVLDRRHLTAGTRRMDQNGLVNAEPRGVTVRVDVQTEDHPELELNNMTKQASSTDMIESDFDSKARNM